MYDPRIHGIWEIAQDEKGVLTVREVKERDELSREQLTVGNGCIEAKHLRSYLAKNLELIEDGLELYVDVFGNDGVSIQPISDPSIYSVSIERHLRHNRADGRWDSRCQQRTTS